MSAIELLKSGFGNGVFVNKNPKTIEGIVMRILTNPKVTLFPKRLKNIKVEPINDLSDKVTLSFSDEDVTSVWSWRKSADGKSYVLNNVE